MPWRRREANWAAGVGDVSVDSCVDLDDDVGPYEI